MPYRDPRISAAERAAVDALVILPYGTQAKRLRAIKRRLQAIAIAEEKRAEEEAAQRMQEEAARRMQEEAVRRMQEEAARRRQASAKKTRRSMPLQFAWRGAAATPTFRQGPARVPLQFAAPKRQAPKKPSPTK